jgi:NADH-quinone oxidoreductase subunit M
LLGTGKVTKEENQNLPDLNAREIATLVPLVVLCFWIGLYPKPFLAFLHQPVGRVAEIIQPEKFGSQVVHAADHAATEPETADEAEGEGEEGSDPH